MTRKKKTSEPVTIPYLTYDRLKERLNDLFNYRKDVVKNKKDQARVKRIVSNIIRQKLKFNLSKDEHVAIPREWFKKAICKRYSKYIGLLIYEDVLERDNYCPDKNKCYAYRINPELVTGDMIMDGYLVDKEDTDNIIDPKNKEFAKDFLKNLELDEVKAKRWVEDYISTINNDAYNINEEIPHDFVNVYHGGEKKPRNIKGALTMARNYKMDLIQTEDTVCVIDNIEDFIERKKTNIYNNYVNYVMHQFRKGIYYANQKPSNLRFYCTLTNCPAELINYVYYNGEQLASIDKLSSQFANLANVLNGRLGYLLDRLDKRSIKKSKQKKDKDNSINVSRYVSDYDIPELEVDDITQLFMDLALGKLDQDLYEYVRDRLGLNSRDEAKDLVIKIIFSNYDSNSKDKERLRQEFPQLVDWCDKFKERNKIKKGFDGTEEEHHSMLSIFLQSVEALVFVELIWSKLITENIPCVPKHDEIIVPESYALRAKDIIDQVYDEIGFEGQFKFSLPEG